MYNKRKLSDYTKYHNKIFLRNPILRNFDEHEIIKTIASLQLYQSYGNDIDFLATEFKIPGTNDLADIYVEFKNGDAMAVEIQKEVTEKWKEKIRKRDLKTGIDTRVIPLKEIHLNQPIPDFTKYL